MTTTTDFTGMKLSPLAEAVVYRLQRLENNIARQKTIQNTLLDRLCTDYATPEEREMWLNRTRWSLTQQEHQTQVARELLEFAVADLNAANAQAKADDGAQYLQAAE